VTGQTKTENVGGKKRCGKHEKSYPGTQKSSKIVVASYCCRLFVSIHAPNTYVLSTSFVLYFRVYLCNIFRAVFQSLPLQVFVVRRRAFNLLSTAGSSSAEHLATLACPAVAGVRPTQLGCSQFSLTPKFATSSTMLVELNLEFGSRPLIAAPYS
jgi:hypothetical protein